MISQPHYLNEKQYLKIHVHGAAKLVIRAQSFYTLYKYNLTPLYIFLESPFVIYGLFWWCFLLILKNFCVKVLSIKTSFSDATAAAVTVLLAPFLNLDLPPTININNNFDKNSTKGE